MLCEATRAVASPQSQETGKSDRKEKIIIRLRTYDAQFAEAAELMQTVCFGQLAGSVQVTSSVAASPCSDHLCTASLRFRVLFRRQCSDNATSSPPPQNPDFLVFLPVSWMISFSWMSSTPTRSPFVSFIFLFFLHQKSIQSKSLCKYWHLNSSVQMRKMYSLCQHGM